MSSKKVSSGDRRGVRLGGLTRSFPTSSMSAVMPEMAHLPGTERSLRMQQGRRRLWRARRSRRTRRESGRSKERHTRGRLLHQIAEYQHSFHYAETNYESEHVSSRSTGRCLRPFRRLALAPLHSAEELVTNRCASKVVETLPASAALRFGWVSPATSSDTRTTFNCRGAAWRYITMVCREYTLCCNEMPTRRRSRSFRDARAIHADSAESRREERHPAVGLSGIGRRLYLRCHESP